MVTKIGALAASRAGASSAEYALILGLVCVALLVGGTALGSAINGRFTAVATVIN